MVVLLSLVSRPYSGGAGAAHHPEAAPPTPQPAVRGKIRALSV